MKGCRWVSWMQLDNHNWQPQPAFGSKLLASALDEMLS
jgi:hypothetical protein